MRARARGEAGAIRELMALIWQSSITDNANNVRSSDRIELWFEFEETALPVSLQVSLSRDFSIERDSGASFKSRRSRKVTRVSDLKKKKSSDKRVLSK